MYDIVTIKGRPAHTLKCPLAYIIGTSEKTVPPIKGGFIPLLEIFSFANRQVMWAGLGLLFSLVLLHIFCSIDMGMAQPPWKIPLISRTGMTPSVPCRK
jgi:hypothetical protein